MPRVDWVQLYLSMCPVAFSLRVWAANFGSSLELCDLLWDYLQPWHGQLHPIHLLWALHFLRTYPTEDSAIFLWCTTAMTYSHRVWFVIGCLDQVLPLVRFDERLLWSPFWLDDERGHFYKVYFTLDGKFCPIQIDRNNWPLNQLFYSGKHKRWGLKYELGCHWRTGHIVWWAGGLTGNVHDLTLARLPGGTLDLIDSAHGERIFGDKGYISAENPQFLCPFRGRDLTPPQQAWNDLFNPIRVLIENALFRLCKYRILQIPFRHGADVQERVQLHRQVFHVLVRIARLDIQLHPLRADHLEDPFHRYLDPDD